MMNSNEITSIIEEILIELAKNNMLEGELNFSKELYLLGPNSPLDSLSFISFLTKLEDHLSIENGSDIYIVLNEVKGFDINKNQMNVRTLVEHIVELTK